MKHCSISPMLSGVCVAICSFVLFLFSTVANAQTHTTTHRTTTSRTHADEEKEPAHSTTHRTTTSRTHADEEKEPAHSTTHRTTTSRTHADEEKEPAHSTTHRTTTSRTHADDEKEPAHSTTHRTTTSRTHADDEKEPAQSTTRRRSAHHDEEPIRASRQPESKEPARILHQPRPTIMGSRLRAEHAELNSPIMQGLRIDKEFNGRLPNGYGKVVTDDQRKEIYDIQKDYADVIELLKIRLLLLEQERDEKVDGLLNRDQIQTLKADNGQLESERHRAKLDEGKN